MSKEVKPAPKQPHKALRGPKPTSKIKRDKPFPEQNAIMRQV
jgi:hypothetical protein